MTTTPAWRRYLTFWRSPIVQDVDDELRFHTNMRIKECIALGMTEDEARRAVAERLGDVGAARAECVELGHVRERNARNADLLDAIRSDLRYALRGLRARPGFATAVILTLALGIGANAAVFSVVDRLLFRPPPLIRDPARTHRVYVSYPMPNLDGSFTLDAIPYRRFVELTNETSSFQRTAPYSASRLAIGVGQDTHDMQVAGVSPTFFTFFDASPALGRYFSATDDSPPNGAPVAVLSYAMWQIQYGGRRDVLGAKVRIGQTLYTVIGVAPRWFVGLWPEEPPVAFIPFSAYAGGFGYRSRGDTWWTSYNFNVAGMLVTRKPGVTVTAAGADLTRAMRLRWNDKATIGPPQFQPTAIAASLLVERGPNQSSASKVAALVGGMALIVLLVAAANVANLLLARALRRRREIAVRLALGASRRRLISQLLTETLLLAVLGGAVGLVAAQWGGTALRTAFLPPGADSPVMTDMRTLTFVGVAVLCAGVLTGLAPAWQSGRLELTRHLKVGTREGTVQPSWGRATLLVIQGALSVLLLVAAGLFVRSLSNVNHVRLGYDVDPVLVVNLNMRGMRLDSARGTDLWQRLLTASRRVPSVDRASLVLGVPLWNLRVGDVGRPSEMDSLAWSRLPDIYMNVVMPDYFAAMGTRIVRGRGIDSTDVAGAARVVVVSTTMAQTFWPGRDALGQCVRLADKTCATVVGVAEDVKNLRLGGDPGLTYYLALAQTPPRGQQLVVRTRGDASRHLEAVRSMLQKEMPSGSFVTVTRFRDVVGNEMRSWRLGATMFVVFGLLAMLLAAVGLYGVISYNVGQRTHEIGVRRALGAQSGDVVQMIVRQGFVVGTAGVAIGGAIALAAAGRLEPLLFGVSARDPVVYIIVAATMIIVAVAASAIPARRAAAIDPNTALRSE